MPRGERIVGLTLGDPAGVGPELAGVALALVPGAVPVRIYGPDALAGPLAAAHPGCGAVPTSAGPPGVSSRQ